MILSKWYYCTCCKRKSELHDNLQLFPSLADPQGIQLPVMDATSQVTSSSQFEMTSGICVHTNKVSSGQAPSVEALKKCMTFRQSVSGP